MAAYASKNPQRAGEAAAGDSLRNVSRPECADAEEPIVPSGRRENVLSVVGQTIDGPVSIRTDSDRLAPRALSKRGSTDQPVRRGSRDLD